jgi:hypothetical protein
MNEMVERVARALHASQRRERAILTDGIDLNGWDALLPRERDGFMRAARAAIAAMREPTEAMLERVTDPHGDLPRSACEYVWKGMIGAALGEPKP